MSEERTKEAEVMIGKLASIYPTVIEMMKTLGQNHESTERIYKEAIAFLASKD